MVTIGLDYQVVVAGARLPAPERQKVALARAMLKRPVALILDRVVGFSIRLRKSASCPRFWSIAKVGR